MKYLIEKTILDGSLLPGIDRIEVMGARYVIDGDNIEIYDYDDNLVLTVKININDDYFKFINIDNDEIIFQNE